MRYEPEKIEEKLIPYIEGVLNSREHREVEEVLRANTQLAREVTDLREVIDGLREGFAGGVKPPQEKLSPEEVIEMAGSAGGVESLRGSSEQKARLFCSDEALEELALLRALQEEMERTSLDIDSVPPLPESLRAEFLRLDSGSAKVIPLARRFSPVPIWRRASQFLDRIDPKPLMASAAALALLSLGVHFYQNPMTGGPNAPQVASGFSDEDERGREFGRLAAASPAAPETIEEEAGAEADLDNESMARGNKASAVDAPTGATRTDKSREPSGVAVFTSDDPDLLKQQAGKLLEKKIRYTVTQDRILVADKDVKPARDVLWSEDAVASVAGEQEKGIAFTRHVSKDSPEVEDEGEEATIPVPRRPGSQAARPSYAPDSDPAPAAGEVKVYSNRESSQQPVARRSKEVKAYSAPPTSARRNQRQGVQGTVGSYNSGGRSALQPKGQAAPKTEGASYRPEPAKAPVVVSPVDQERTEVANAPEISQERRQKLRELALGKDREATAPKLEEVSKKDGDWEVPESPSGGSKSSGVETQTITRARNYQVERSPAKTAPVANAVTLENSDRGYPDDGVAMQSQAATGSSAPRTPAKPAEQPGGGSVVDALDTRLAAIQSVRGAVAARHDVSISVDSRAGKVTVYVRPKTELSKAELNDLRAALRRELGLAETDTIIFR